MMRMCAMFRIIYVLLDVISAIIKELTSGIYIQVWYQTDEITECFDDVITATSF